MLGICCWVKCLFLFSSQRVDAGARDGNAGPLCDFWDGRTGVHGEGKSTVGKIADTHVDTDDVVLGLLGSIFGTRVVREGES